ncbi:MAG: ribonuclease H, partial [Dehalococcoidia bacterium]
MPAFMCTRCGDRFEVPQATLDRYANWTPQTCITCRPAAKAARADKFNKMRGGGAKRPAAGASGTAELNLPVAEILTRFTAGPKDGVFTDGSCSGNPGPGGWGVVQVRDGEIVAQKHGHDPATTNNRMELTAMIAGLELLEPGADAAIYTDSLLVVNTVTKWAANWEKLGWKRKEGEVKNLDLVQRAYALAKEHPNVRVQWIKAHDGSRWNEYADALSTAYLRAEV